MPADIASEKVYRILDLIAHRPHLSQREMASTSGLSLGLVNITLNRLVKTGHIKVASLNRRKVNYILTSKGFMEKTKRTYSYITGTIHTFMEYRRRLSALVQDLTRNGDADFAVRGEGEVAELLEVVLGAARPVVRHRRIPAGEAPREGEVLLDCALEGRSGGLGVSVLSRLLEDATPAPAGRPASSWAGEAAP